MTFNIFFCLFVHRLLWRRVIWLQHLTTVTLIPSQLQVGPLSTHGFGNACVQHVKACYVLSGCLPEETVILPLTYFLKSNI